MWVLVATCPVIRLIGSFDRRLTESRKDLDCRESCVPLIVREVFRPPSQRQVIPHSGISEGLGTHAASRMSSEDRIKDPKGSKLRPPDLMSWVWSWPPFSRGLWISVPGHPKRLLQARPRPILSLCPWVSTKLLVCRYHDYVPFPNNSMHGLTKLLI